MIKRYLTLTNSGALLIVLMCTFLADFEQLSFFSGNAAEVSSSKHTPDTFTEWPVPDSYVSGIPVYNKFEALESLFRFENDTTYIINFWATWCKPCVEELPHFEELHSRLKNEKVKIILVSLDLPHQVESKLIPFVQKNELKSHVVILLDGKYNEWIDKVSPDWSGAIPATYIYNQDQNLLAAYPFESMEELSHVIKPFL